MQPNVTVYKNTKRLHFFLQLCHYDSLTQFDINQHSLQCSLNIESMLAYSLHIMLQSGVYNENTCCRRGRESPAERGGQPHSHSNTGRWGLPHFHPFHISAPLHAPPSPSMILFTSSYSNCNRAMGVLRRKKDIAVLPDTWLCPAVTLPAVKVFIEMKSG